MTNSKKVKQNWTRPENFDICFSISFDHYCEKLIFVGRLDTKPVLSINFEVFYSIPDFERSKIVRQLVRQLVYKVYYTRYFKFRLTYSELNLHVNTVFLDKYGLILAKLT